MKAILVDPAGTACLKMGETEDPTPKLNEALIRVTHFSLNRGEVRYAAGKEEGERVGWDFVGVVIKEAAIGSGPANGTRVVGFSKKSEAFAELICVEPEYLAPIPNGVSDEEAACLPVAGLTALYVLERGHRLLCNRVLITGATGGVGHIAVQLAHRMGAIVTAQVRDPKHVSGLIELGADEVVVDKTGKNLKKFGPFQLVVEGVGGAMASHAISALAPRGTCVLFGPTAGDEVTISVSQMLSQNYSRVEGFILFQEHSIAPASNGLARLLYLCAIQELKIDISVTKPWEETPQVAQDLMDRKYTGKAVMVVDEGSALESSEVRHKSEQAKVS